MPEIEEVLSLLVTLLAAGIFVLALLAYRRRPSARTLLLAIAFAIYATKGLLLSGEILFEAQETLLETLGVAAEAAFLILISLAFLRN